MVFLHSFSSSCHDQTSLVNFLEAFRPPINVSRPLMTADSLKQTGEGGKVLQVPVLMSYACTKRADSTSGQTPPETYSVLPIIVAVAR